MKVLVADKISAKGVAYLRAQEGLEVVEAYGSSPEKMLKLVEERAIEQDLLARIDLQKGSLETLTLPQKSCDAVFLSQSLHHTSSPDALVRMSAARGGPKRVREGPADVGGHPHIGPH